jgi:hypothetical protein
MTSYRDEAGSKVLPTKAHPSATLQTPAEAVTACGGNPQLLSARLSELTASIRALDRSNTLLQEALKETPDDGDFMEALQENRGALRRQAPHCAALVHALQSQGANVQVDSDVLQAVQTVEHQEAVEARKATQETVSDHEDGGLHL